MYVRTHDPNTYKINCHVRTISPRSRAKHHILEAQHFSPASQWLSCDGPSNAAISANSLFLIFVWGTCAQAILINQHLHIQKPTSRCKGSQSYFGALKCALRTRTAPAQTRDSVRCALARRSALRARSDRARSRLAHPAAAAAAATADASTRCSKEELDSTACTRARNKNDRQLGPRARDLSRARKPAARQRAPSERVAVEEERLQPVVVGVEKN